MVSDTFRLFLVKNTVLDDFKCVSIVFIFHDLQRYIEFNEIGHLEENSQSSKNPIPTSELYHYK